MTRKHFDFIAVNAFCVSAPSETPTQHAAATFSLDFAWPGDNRPNLLVLSLWVGFGNGDKHAGDATPSTDDREAVPASDPKRSGRATRDGWQPVALLNTDDKTASFVSRSVDDSRFVGHVAASLVARGYKVEGVNYAVTIFDAVESKTTLSRTGVPYSTQHRNTDANTATHRQRAQAGGNRLMEFGRNGGR